MLSGSHACITSLMYHPLDPRHSQYIHTREITLFLLTKRNKIERCGVYTYVVSVVSTGVGSALSVEATPSVGELCTG